ncbi:SOS response-associated peptidase family protein [Pseudolysinimonas sp.]|uniref:SOS response-associated peptidase family protein n=1 Tax=Pseudolysinimonas sp. TaxID=2680009 RepID=UPI00286C3159|nr:SOS response-associated peptidase family protein [Pseudolysinimonas sp.]
MCASYGLQVEAADIHYGFSVIDELVATTALSGWLEEFRAEPAKPTGVHRRNLNPIVRERAKDGERLRSVDLAWWKLWVRGEPAKFPAINARIEGLVGSGAWSGPLTSRRGLVPATEYYEKGHRFALPDEPKGLFAFAGLWNVNKAPDPETGEDRWMVSYTIVTQPAAPHVALIHDRMPLILPRELYDDWLDPTRTGDQELLDEAVAASRPLGKRLQVSEL